jgi:hypothetical protein
MSRNAKKTWVDSTASRCEEGACFSRFGRRSMLLSVSSTFRFVKKDEILDCTGMVDE